MRHLTALWAATILWSVALAPLLSGCIYMGPTPPDVWPGAKPTTQPMPQVKTTVPDDSNEPLFARGVTRVSAERVVEIARAALEPEYGPAGYIRDELPNGRTLHKLLFPRYDVSFFGCDYSWEQVDVNFNPETKNSVVNVDKKAHFCRPFMFSGHGGLWPFPTSWVSEMTGDREKRILQVIMERMSDPKAVITDVLRAD